MFSSRTPANLERNRLSQSLQRLRGEGASIIDLTESNPTRAGFDYPADLLDELARAATLVYEPEPFGLSSARRTVAAEVARRGVHVSPARIALTASTSEAYSYLFKLLCAPDERVLVPRPSYPLVEYLARLDAIGVQPYDLEYHGRWSIDFASLTRALDADGGPARAVLVVNPNNPTGSALGRHELAELAAFCGARDLALIGDEVFADYVWPGGDAGVSVLDQSAALAFALGGLSKSAGLPQMKLGWIAAAGPPLLVDAALARLEVIADAYLSVGTAVQQGIDALIEAGVGIRAQIGRRVARNLTRLGEIAASHPSCGVLHADAGWYAVIEIPAIRSEEDFVVELLEADRVLVHPGYFFDFPREAFLVVSLLAPEADFAAGVARALARASR